MLCLLHPDSPDRCYAGDAPFCEAAFNDRDTLMAHMMAKHRATFWSLATAKRQDARRGSPIGRAWVSELRRRFEEREAARLFAEAEALRKQEERDRREYEARVASAIALRDKRRHDRRRAAEERRIQAEEAARLFREAEERERRAAWRQRMDEAMDGALALYDPAEVDALLDVLVGAPV